MKTIKLDTIEGNKFYCNGLVACNFVPRAAQPQGGGGQAIAANEK